MEAEKQVKFFQGCVAAAFAERDHSIMEVMIVSIFFLNLSGFQLFTFEPHFCLVQLQILYCLA